MVESRKVSKRYKTSNHLSVIVCRQRRRNVCEEGAGGVRWGANIRAAIFSGVTATRVAVYL